MLKTTPITPALGGLVHEVDLSSPISDELFEALHAALLRYQVLVIPGQPISDEAHLDLARRFGPLSIHPVSAASGKNETMEWIEDGPDSPPKATQWHADLSWLPAPPKIALLCAQELPECGGDTMWMSLKAAYESLSQPMKDRLEGLVAVHDAGANFFVQVEYAAGKQVADKLRQRVQQSAPHPLVVRHPETGEKSLCFSPPNVTEIVGLHPEESQMLIDFLRALVERPTFALRWQWTVGDLVIWDERTTLHVALPDHYPARRVVRRCTVDPEAPPRAA